METKTDREYILAVDIGGTKTATAIIDVHGQICARRKQPTCQSGPDDGIAQIIIMLEDLLCETQLSKGACLGTGVGIPAVLEHDTDFVIWGPNLRGWRGVNLRGALEDHFDLPVVIEYDGHAAALGEWWLGAGKNYQTFVEVIIGTGIGGGMIVDGHLFRGKNRLAGAAGWFVLTEDNQPSYVDDFGNHLGYWETKAAGPGIADKARSLIDQYPDSALARIHQSERIEARHVFSTANKGDPLAERVLNEFVIFVGRGIANIVSLINPEAIILGGGVGTHCDFLLSKIKEEISRWAQPVSGGSVNLVISSLGSEAGLLGAAYGALLRINFSQRKENV